MLSNIKAPQKYLELLTLYEKGLCPLNEGISLFQFLLDTDQCWDDPMLTKTAHYLMSEGYCYYVYTP
jgi:hypothetical protein